MSHATNFRIQLSRPTSASNFRGCQSYFLLGNTERCEHPARLLPPEENFGYRHYYGPAKRFLDQAPIKWFAIRSIVVDRKIAGSRVKKTALCQSSVHFQSRIHIFRSDFVQLVNKIDGERQDQQRKSTKPKFWGTHLLSGLFHWISEMGKTVTSGNLTLLSGVPGTPEKSVRLPDLTVFPIPEMQMNNP